MMSSTRTLVQGALSLSVIVLALLIATQAASAKKAYTDKDLDDTYRFMSSEVRVQPPDMEYCSVHWVIEFDGSGSATIVSSLRRCTLHPAATTQVDIDPPGNFHYQVFPNGEILMIDLDDLGVETDYVTHGQIVQKGDLLIFDGTASFPAHTDFLLMTAVAARE